MISMLTATLGCSAESSNEEIQNVDVSVSDSDSKEYNDYFVLPQQQEYQLDIDLQRDISQAFSNADISNVYADYADRWRALIDEYYSLIENFDVSDDYPEIEEYKKSIKNLAIKSQTEWEVYAEKALADYSEYLLAVYGSGSISPSVYQQYRLELNRYRAIQLYKIAHGDLFIDCERP